MQAKLVAESERPEERPYHDLARAVPGFGGYFIDDDGILVAYVTDAKQFGKMKAELSRILDQYRRQHSASALRGVGVRLGQFDFPTLARWREIVSAELLGRVEGVVSSGIDHSLNRLEIGADLAKHPSLRANVLELLRTHGIPANAIVFVQMGPFRLHNGLRAVSALLRRAPPNTTLRDQPVPLTAGYINSFSAGNTCTFGPTVMRDGQQMVATNSHCTPTLFGFDGTAIQYLVDPSGWTTIGTESLDPAPVPGTCPQNNCRFSDAALFAVNSGVDFRPGRIARTVSSTSPDTLWAPGSITLSSDPFYAVIGATISGNLTLNEWLFKVGQSSGTTQGRVKNGCLDI